MGALKNLPAVFLISLNLCTMSCEKQTGDLLRSMPDKTNASQFNTIAEAPSADPATRPKRDPKLSLGDANTTGGPTDASTGFLPTGPDPFPAHPPIPTDDDFDDFDFDDGLAAPYGVCGNGRVDRGEQCDDKNTDNTDGCNILCQYPTCGNGVVEKNEECDDNNTDDADGCNNRCLFERCGNKRLDANEQCDDGNLDPGDGCSPCCLYEVCGNKVVDPREQCDDGVDPTTELPVSGDGCSEFCQLERCGDGIVAGIEECDDGNLIDGDCCTNLCKLGVCALK